MAAAAIYHELGIPVIPFKIMKSERGNYDKQNLSSWKKWETEPQTDEEFMALNWREANAFAIILGTQAKNGLFLSIIDYDVKGDVRESAKTKGKELIKEFPITHMDETVNKGIHLVYWSRIKPRTIGTFHDIASLELLGEKKLCVMPPSLGYRTLNDNTPTEIDNLEATFQAIMKKQKLIISQKTETVTPITQRKAYSNKIRPCITQALNLQLTGPNGHLMRLTIAGEYKRLGYSDQEIIDLFKTQNDFKEDVCKSQVASAEPGKTASCNTINEWGYCLPDCKMNEHDVYVQKPMILTQEFLAEEIWDRKQSPQYLVYYFETDHFETKSEISLDEINQKGQRIIYIPVYNDAVKKGLIILPSDYTQTTFKEVFEEIDKFALSSYDPCGQEALVKLLTRIALGSWFLDRFISDPLLDVAGSGKFAPIIPIRGPSQSGKNRLAFVLRLLSYRPYFEMSTYRIPSLYRPLDLWQGTLVLDEADFANTNEKSELVHFLNCRATGTPLSRQNPKNPSITDTFSNFGLTIVTQRRPFDDNATESRAIPYYSEVSDKKLPVIETDEMLKQGLQLQNKLLYLRMKYYRKITINKEAWIENVNDHRLVASLLPLIALSNYEPSLKDMITKTAKEVEKAKIEEKANSMDGLIVNLLWEKINENLFEKWRPNIFYILESREMEVKDEIEKEHKTALTTKHIADLFKWSPQSIRKALASLGIVEKGLKSQVKVDGRNTKVIFFDPCRLEKRLREFVIDYKPGQVGEVTRVTGVTVSLCDIQKSPLFINSKRSGVSHLKTVTSVTTVTEPFPPDYDDKCEPPNQEDS